MSPNGASSLLIDGQTIEKIDKYVYLDHEIKLGREDQTAEIDRRVSMTWAVFGKLSFIFKNPEVPINLKKKIHNTCILSVMSYGLERSLTIKSTQTEKE